MSDPIQNFFIDVAGLVFYTNICSTIYFKDDENDTGRIEQIILYDKELPIGFAGPKDFSQIYEYIKEKIEQSDIKFTFNKPEIIEILKQHYKEILDTRNKTYSKPMSLKLISVINLLENKVACWTSVPTLGNNLMQASEYFDSILKWASSSLKEEDFQTFQRLTQLIYLDLTTSNE